ncbi:MAG TPA: hypothetical protein VFL96_07085 [Acidobacteriaceae bacterium]|nr:hypothetical protein [Acidobacteriaceae bacterium]
MGQFIPPEVSSAVATLSAARQDALPTSAARRARVAFFLATWAVGSWLGLLLLELGLVTPSDKDIWRASLTAISVLSGFMIATMLFTGKVDVAKSLSLSELRDVTLKSNYLLLYQLGTLLNHFSCLLLMLLIPSVNLRWPSVAPSVAVAGCGLFFVSLVRSVFIPLQIIEIHRFTHAALLREKRDEAGNTEHI